MPWTETAPMKERVRFVTDWERGLYSMTELCARYGVSRKTGYKWCPSGKDALTRPGDPWEVASGSARGQKLSAAGRPAPLSVPGSPAPGAPPASPRRSTAATR